MRQKKKLTEMIDDERKKEEGDKKGNEIKINKLVATEIFKIYGMVENFKFYLFIIQEYF